MTVAPAHAVVPQQDQNKKTYMVMGFGFWVSGGVVKRNILAQIGRFRFWVNSGGDALMF
jgi:hypothetical protein